MFGVDDIIFTDIVDLTDCTQALKKYKTWFFSLRLGTNITHTIANPVLSLERVHAGIPTGANLENRMFLWNFSDPTAKGSWNYPNSVDVTIYRKKAIKRFLRKAKYDNPNMLESEWHWHWQPKNKRGLCYLNSKAVNIPLNVVNPYWTSANLNLSAWQLLDKFVKGEKIDISKFDQVRNTAPHMSYEPTFIPRVEPMAIPAGQTAELWMDNTLHKAHQSLFILR